MRKVFTLFLLVMIFGTAKSQYYSNSYKFPVTHRHLPNFFTYEDEKKYYIDFKSTLEVEPFVNSAKVSSLVDFGDWQEVDDPSQAFVVVSLTLKDLIIDNVRPVQLVDPHGKIVFKPVFDCLITRAMSVRSELENQVFPNAKTVISQEVEKFYPEPFLAENYVRDNKEYYLRTSVESYLQGTMDEINKYFLDSYLYTLETEEVKLYFFDSSKNKNYKKHQQAKAEIKQILNDLSANRDVNAARQAMQPWIDHFKSLYESLDANNKKQGRCKEYMLCNLVEIYYALEFYDLARQYAEDLKEQFPDSDATKMIQQIYKVQNMLEAHHLSTRYF